MDKPFTGKVAVVTGGSSGIGRATALAFAAEGARVAVASRRPAESEETVRMITAQGGEACFIATDVAREPDVKRLIAETMSRWGHLDFAFNNAGILGPAFVPTPDYPLADWERVLSVNLTGVFLAMKYEIPAMLTTGGGAIVNMSSVAGKIGGPVSIAYYSSKHGVIGATKGAAMEYAARGIRVNAVCPAIIKTPMADETFPPEMEAGLIAAHPIGRFGAPEEVAAAVTFLCSEKASFITGLALDVDGGLLSR
jgi:NAD(P)-dependent dehydrogenase (short-subunit alcohol dehydrogenase family)